MVTPTPTPTNAPDVEQPPPHIFLFLGITLLAGAFVKFSLGKSRIPYTVAMFLMGMICGLFVTFIPQLGTYIPIDYMPPTFIFYIFFPILIFQGSFEFEGLVFKETVWQLLLLAFPGLVIGTFVTAGFMKAFMYPDWSWIAALLYGSIISATDPVATVALLRELNADKFITGILDGESIFNDGSSIVMFALLMPSMLEGQFSSSFGEIVLSTFQLCFGAVVLGVFCGGIMVYSLERVHNDPLVDVALTYGTSMVAFYLADTVCGFSGVITLAVAGLCFSFRRYCVSPQSAKSVNEFWEILVHMANTLIFTMVGFLVAKDGLADITIYDCAMIVVLYIGVTIARIVLVVASWPIMNLVFPISWQNIVLIAFSGLRGAVALTLSLAIRHDTRIDKNIRKLFLLLTAGIVIMTIFINGIFCQPLIERLGLTKKPTMKKAEMALLCKAVRIRMRQSLSELTTDPQLYRSQLGVVREKSWLTFVDPYNGKNDPPEMRRFDKLASAKFAYMRNVKRTVVSQYEEGKLGHAGFYALHSAVAHRLEKGNIIQYSHLEKLFDPTSSESKAGRIIYTVLLHVMPGYEQNFVVQNLEISMAYRAAMLNVLKFLGESNIHLEVRKGLQEIAELELSRVETHLREFMQHYPDIDYSIKTKICTRVVLNDANSTVDTIEAMGAVSNEECKKIREDLNDREKSLARKLTLRKLPKSAHEAIQDLELFKTLDKSDLHEIEQTAVLTQYIEGETITPSEEHVIFIACGIITTCFGDVVCEYGEGTMIGWNTTCPEVEITHSTLTPVITVKIRKSELNTLMARYTSFQTTVLRHQARQETFLLLSSAFPTWERNELRTHCDCGYIYTVHTEDVIVFESACAVFVLLSGRSLDGEFAVENDKTVVVPQVNIVKSWIIGTRVYVVPLALEYEEYTQMVHIHRLGEDLPGADMLRTSTTHNFTTGLSTQPSLSGCGSQSVSPRHLSPKAIGSRDEDSLSKTARDLLTPSPRKQKTTWREMLGKMQDKSSRPRSNSVDERPLEFNDEEMM